MPPLAVKPLSSSSWPSKPLATQLSLSTFPGTGELGRLLPPDHFADTFPSPALSPAPRLSPLPHLHSLLDQDQNDNQQWQFLELASKLASIPDSPLVTPRTDADLDILRSGSDGETSGNSSEAAPPNPRFKTEYCRNFKEKGKCVYGDLCQFAHGAEEMREVGMHTNYKTKPCRKYWIAGACPYGPRCNFMHNEPQGQPRDGRVQPGEGRVQPGESRAVGTKVAIGLPLGQDSGIDSSISPNSTSPPAYKGPPLGTKLTPPPVLDSLHRPPHGSGRMAAIVKGERYLWIDTWTGLVVYN